MSVRVEFYGIPRQRAGTAAAAVDAARLGDLLAELALRYPPLAECCLDGGHLRSGYLANLNGARFISNAQTPLAAGDVVLILSADAGG